MRAVHFGAGNIGRGFIGAVLQDSGYFVTFADVNQGLIDQLIKARKYSLIELGVIENRTTYKNFQVLHSSTQESNLIEEIGKADVITASVGANILPYIAPAIAKGIQARMSEKPLVIMACENAINATDILQDKVLELLGEMPQRVYFANTAVDRIVPMQPPETEPNVIAESFCEWVIDTSKLDGIDLKISAATMVDDLEPFIERKLYTVNTAHLTIAYMGQRHGHKTISSALTDPIVRSVTARVMEETSMALVTKHGLEAHQHAEYVRLTLLRLANPALDDQVERVGRQPIRKLSRYERLIGPAALLAEYGEEPTALLEVVDAALSFVNNDDPEVAILAAKLASLSSEEFVEEICGIGPDHVMFEQLRSRIAMRQGTLSHK